MKAALFPGQGFQRFGMLAPLAARFPAQIEPVLAAAEAALPGLGLRRLLLGQGEPCDVTPTALAQPLLLAHGIASFKVWTTSNQNTVPKYALGHSLGEYTALTASGVLGLEEALVLVRQRGLLMSQQGEASASEASTGATATTSASTAGATATTTATTAGDTAAAAGATTGASPEGVLGMTTVLLPRNFTLPPLPYIDIAAYNSPTQIVLSGTLKARSAAIAALSAAAGRKLVAKHLAVSSAFHSRHMAAAAQQFEPVLAALPDNFAGRAFDVVSNVTARPFASMADVRANLLSGLTSPVEWRRSVEFAAESVDAFVAFGEVGKLMARDVKVPTEVN